MSEPRKLRVFLCHASQDKPIVRELYQRLNAEGWIDPWLDEEKLLPGQDWEMEIEKAVEVADAVIVLNSKESITKEGYIQKELRHVLDVALKKPEETIFVIPVRLDNCVLVRGLSKYQYVDYFPADRKDKAYKRVLSSLELRANVLNIQVDKAVVLVGSDEQIFIIVDGQIYFRRKPVHLSKISELVLKCMIEAGGNTLSAEFLQNYLWGALNQEKTTTLAVYEAVRRLRNEMVHEGINGDSLRSIRGKGYKLELE